MSFNTPDIVTLNKEGVKKKNVVVGGVVIPRGTLHSSLSYAGTEVLCFCEYEGHCEPQGTTMRRLAASTALVLLGLGLSSCDSPPTASEPQEITAEKMERLLSSAPPQSSEEAYQKLAEAFPSIIINDLEPPVSSGSANTSAIQYDREGEGQKLGKYPLNKTDYTVAYGHKSGWVSPRFTNRAYITLHTWRANSAYKWHPPARELSHWHWTAYRPNQMKVCLYGYETLTERPWERCIGSDRTFRQMAEEVGRWIQEIFYSTMKITIPWAIALAIGYIIAGMMIGAPLGI